MKAGTLSQAVAQAAIEKAEEEVRAIERVEPEREERQTARIIRMLPNAARVLRERIRGGNLGLRDPRSIVQGRNTLFAMFGGKVPLRPAQVRPGEKPYLIARVGLNRNVLIEAAGSFLKVGSGGVLRTCSIFPLFAPTGVRGAVLPPARCGNGHELTPDNLVPAERGTRWRCRQCGADRAAAWRRRRTAAA